MINTNARLAFEDSNLKTGVGRCENMSSNEEKLLPVCLCSYPNLFTFQADTCMHS